MLKNQALLKEYIVCQGNGNIISDMDGEKVMLCISKGKYYNLGDIGGEIWDLIQEPVSINRVIETLTSQYEVDLAECEEQVLVFLELLAQEDLIVIKVETV